MQAYQTNLLNYLFCNTKNTLITQVNAERVEYYYSNTNRNYRTTMKKESSKQRNPVVVNSVFRFIRRTPHIKKLKNVKNGKMKIKLNKNDRTCTHHLLLALILLIRLLIFCLATIRTQEICAKCQACPA